MSRPTTSFEFQPENEQQLSKSDQSSLPKCLMHSSPPSWSNPLNLLTMKNIPSSLPRLLMVSFRDRTKMKPGICGMKTFLITQLKRRITAPSLLNYPIEEKDHSSL